ncbi:pilus assembly protein N-terminal domain-containing protein [Candidatus Margulisiibacteriota bacterium]
MKKKNIIILLLLIFITSQAVCAFQSETLYLIEGEQRLISTIKTIARYFAEDPDIAGFSKDRNEQLLLNAYNAGETFIHFFDGNTWSTSKVVVDMKGSQTRRPGMPAKSDYQVAYQNEYNNKLFHKGYSGIAPYQYSTQKLNWKQKTGLGALDTNASIENTNGKTNVGLFKTGLKHKSMEMSFGDHDLSISPQTIPYLHIQGFRYSDTNAFYNDYKCRLEAVSGVQNYSSWGTDTRGASVPSGNVSGLNARYTVNRHLTLGGSIFSLENNSLTQNSTVRFTAVNAELKPVDNLIFSAEASSTEKAHAYLAKANYDYAKLNLSTELFKVEPAYQTVSGRVLHWAQEGRSLRGNYRPGPYLTFYFDLRQYRNLDPATVIPEKQYYFNSYENGGVRYSVKETGTGFYYSGWYRDRASYTYGNRTRGSRWQISQPWDNMRFYYRYLPLDYTSNSDQSQNYSRSESALGMRWRINKKLSCFWENQHIQKIYTDPARAGERPEKRRYGFNWQKITIWDSPLYCSGYLNIESGESILSTANRTILTTSIRIDYMPENSALSGFFEAMFINADSPQDSGQEIEELQLGRDQSGFKFGLSYSVGRVNPEYQQFDLQQTKLPKYTERQSVKVKVKVQKPLKWFIDEMEAGDIVVKPGSRKLFDEEWVEHNGGRITFTRTE